jgi:hypothetical protein
MNEIIGEIQRLKASARNQSDQGQFETGAKTLLDGIETLQTALIRQDSLRDSTHQAPDPDSTEETLMTKELADLYGILGGVRRKQGALVLAVAAYDQGFQYESNPRYGLVNTYNALNRLVTRVLLCPASLSDPNAFQGLNELEFVDVPKALKELQTELNRKVEDMQSNDFWAAGDLAFTCALNGDDLNALDALRRFESCSPPPPAWAYSAYLHTISTVACLDTPRKEALEKIKALFEDRMNRSFGNVPV